MNVFVHGWRQLRCEGRRYLTVAVALCFGVALLFGTLVASQTVSRQLYEGVKSLSGFADVGIVSKMPGVPIDESMVSRIAQVSGVRTAIPSLTMRTTVRGGVPGGHDHTYSMMGYPTAPFNALLTRLGQMGRLPSTNADEVLLPSDIAKEIGVTVGENIAVSSSVGATQLTVVGVFPPANMGALAYNTIFVDLRTAQRLFALPNTVSRVDVMLDGKVTPEQWMARFGTDLPGGLMVQETSSVRSAFAPLLATISLLLIIASGVTLGVSMMLGVTAFEESLSARRETFALMRAVGASGRWLASRVVAEALLLSMVCTVIGLALGVFVSWVLAQLISSAGSLPVGVISVEAWQILVASVCGILAGLIGASRTVLRVVQLPPLTGLTHPDPAHADTWRGRINRKAVVVTITVLAAGTATLALNSLVGWLVGFLLLIVGAGLCAPLVVRVIAGLLGTLRWPVGFAAARLRRQGAFASTAAITAAIVCLSAALTVGVHAISAAMETQLARQFGADVQVSTSVPVESSLIKKLSGVAGIDAVSATVSSSGELAFHGKAVPNGFLAVDPDTYFVTAGLPWVRGNDTDTLNNFRNQDAIIVPEAVAHARGMNVGDTVVLSRMDKKVELRVVGTFAALSTGTQVIVSTSSAKRLGVDGVTGWNIKAIQGVDVVRLKNSVQQALGEIPGLSVFTGYEMKQRGTSQLSQYAGAVFGVVILALALGSLGAAGVLALSVLQRAREIGLFRAIGVHKRKVRWMIISETGIVAVISSCCGLLIGVIAGLLLTNVVSASLGVTLGFGFSPLLFVIVLAISVCSLILAAILPSLRASRVNPVVALTSI